MRLKLTCPCGASFEYEDPEDQAFYKNHDKGLYDKVNLWRTDHADCLPQNFETEWKMQRDGCVSPGRERLTLADEIARNRSVDADAWIFRVHPVSPGSTFPPNQECPLCGRNDKQDFFIVKGDGKEEAGDYVFVHVECFVSGEFKYKHDKRMIYYMHKGG